MISLRKGLRGDEIASGEDIQDITVMTGLEIVVIMIIFVAVFIGNSVTYGR